MAVTVEQLLVTLEANIKKYEKEMAKTVSIADRQMRAVERRAQDMTNRVDRIMSSAGAGISRSVGRFFTLAAGGLALNEMRKAADQFTQIMNQLRVANVPENQLRETFDRIAQSAQRNFVPIEALTKLYSRLSQSQKTLNASSGDLEKVTETVARALRISGVSAETARGALLQLGQSLSSGQVQAEEYNSLIDGLYPLLQAAAAGLKEAGGDVGKLTRLVKDSKVSSEAFFRAILAGAPVLEQKLKNAVTTTGQALTNLSNNFIIAVGEFNTMTGTTDKIVTGINKVSEALPAIGRAAGQAALDMKKFFDELNSGFTDWLNTYNRWANRTITRANEVIGDEGAPRRSSTARRMREAARETADAVAEMEVVRRRGLESEKKIAAEEDKLANRFRPDRRGSYDAGSKGMLQFEREAARLKDEELERTRGRNAQEARLENEREVNRAKALGDRVKTEKMAAKEIAQAKAIADGTALPGAVSIKDFPVDGKKKENDYTRELEQTKKRTEALKAEAMTIGQSTFEIEKNRIAQELLYAAKQAELEITPKLKEEIDKAATGYANAAVKVEELKKAQEGMQQLQTFIGQQLSSFFSDIVSGGENAEKAIMNLLKRIAEAALQAALLGSGPLAGLFGTAGPSGQVGGLIGALFGAFGGARARGGPTEAGKSYIVGEKGPEILSMGSRSGYVTPNKAMTRQGANGGGWQISVAADVDKSGNLIPIVTQISRQATAPMVRQGMATVIATEQKRQRATQTRVM